MGPYPCTKAGNSVIFVCLDHFSKFVWLQPMRHAVAAEVIKFLETKIVHQYRVPEFIHSDNGKQFVFQIFGELMTSYGIRHVKTGLDRSVLQILRATIATDQRNWDTQVSRIECALRNGLHESIGMEGDPQISLPDKMELIRQKVTQGLNRTHERAKKAYNTRGKLVEFSEGQVVYRKNYRQSNKADGYNAKLGRIEFAVLYSSVRVKRYISWAMQWGKVSGYSILKTCMSPEPLNVIRRLQKATNLELWDCTS